MHVIRGFQVEGVQNDWAAEASLDQRAQPKSLHVEITFIKGKDGAVIFRWCQPIYMEGSVNGGSCRQSDGVLNDLLQTVAVVCSELMHEVKQQTDLFLFWQRCNDLRSLFRAVQIVPGMRIQ